MVKSLYDSISDGIKCGTVTRVDKKSIMVATLDAALKIMELSHLNENQQFPLDSIEENSVL